MKEWVIQWLCLLSQKKWKKKYPNCTHLLHAKKIFGDFLHIHTSTRQINRSRRLYRGEIYNSTIHCNSSKIDQETDTNESVAG